MAEAEALKKGNLSSGKTWQILKSAKSAVSVGEHVVFTILDSNDEILNHDSLSKSEKMEAFGHLMEFLQDESSIGKWMLALNGPGLIVRPTFHLHGIISRKEAKFSDSSLTLENFWKGLKLQRTWKKFLPSLLSLRKTSSKKHKK